MTSKFLFGSFLLFVVGFTVLMFAVMAGVVEGWWVFIPAVSAVAGAYGCFWYGLEKGRAEPGYRRWRNAVWFVQKAVNEQGGAVRLGELVAVLGDPVLEETYNSLVRSRAREILWRQQNGDHSDR